MKYRYLGKSGLLLSRITLGTMTFGAADWGCDEKESQAIIMKYIDGGGNSIDCADIYAGGRSEEIIGNLMFALKRDDIAISSKCFFPAGSAATSFGLSRKHVIASCEASLRRMKTDYIDIYYVHAYDPMTRPEETLRALDDLVRQGKIRYIGCSNLFGWQMVKMAGIAARYHLESPVAAQCIYNLVHRELEREVIPAAVDQGMGILCYSALGGGLLTGKYSGMKAPAKGTRLSYRSEVDGPRFWNPRGLQTADILNKISTSSGVPITTLAIAWPLKRRFVTSVIIGARNLQQLEANLEAANWDIPDSLFNKLEKKTRPDEEYMTWFTKRNYDRFFAAADFHDEESELP